jgi:hypothetical protein
MDDVTGHYRARVWFGEHVLAEYRGDEAQARRYAAAMERRFAGCRVTVDLAGQDTEAPRERHWAVSVW